MRAILVDDEQKARNMLSNLLEEYCPSIEILAACENVPTAVAAIHEHRPDVVFLDIDMPGYNGFQLLEFFSPINFEVIFTTAFSEYALKAFQVSALDFLQKPIDIDLLIAAVEKLKKRKGQSFINQQMALIKENNEAKAVKKIAIQVADGIVFLKVKEILYLKADRSYTEIYLENSEIIIASKNIKEFDEILAGNPDFLRVQRSYIANLTKVEKYNRTDGGTLQIQGGNEIPISKEVREEVLKRLEI